LIRQFTNAGDVVYDPFSGAGTVPLEAWIAGRRTIGNDLNPYACLLTQAKLFPPASLASALGDIEDVANQISASTELVDLRTIPLWVRSFFNPDTLREVVAWNQILRKQGYCFLRACLLGILHHQRPGFLSFPSSHSVPYLRHKKFPRSSFPELYGYRSLRDRLEAKVTRALKRLPNLDFAMQRKCYSKNAAFLTPPGRVDAIITSPPYMHQLDYARDNRLRLWFLGISNWRELDQRISPGEPEFLSLLKQCFGLWQGVLPPHGRCVLVLGDTFSRLYHLPLPDAVTKIATEEVGGYKLLSRYSDQIPDARRVRRGLSGNLFETVLVFERQKGNNDA